MPDWAKTVIVMLAITVLLTVVMLFVAVSAAAAIAIIVLSGIISILVRSRKNGHLRSEYLDS